jgi:hypothetical protein
MPGSLRRRDWLTAIAVASLAIIFLASAIAYRVSSRPDRDVWAIVFAMASAVMLGLVTARKLSEPSLSIPNSMSDFFSLAPPLPSASSA